MAKRPQAFESSSMTKRPRDTYSSNLDSIISSVSRISQSTQLARKAQEALTQTTQTQGPSLPREYTTTPPDTSLANYLQSMRDVVDNYSLGSQLEIELRFGTIQQTRYNTRCRLANNSNAAIVLTENDMHDLELRFRNGVLESDYTNYLKKKLNRFLQSEGTVKHTEVQTAYLLEDSKRVIQTKNIDTNTSVFHSQVKKRLGSVNIFLPQCPYDCRLSISCEFPMQACDESEASISEKASLIRHKERISAIQRDVRIDLTKVSSTQETTFEVEMELIDTFVQQWLQQADEDKASWKAAMMNACALWKYVRIFMPNADEAFHTSWDFPASNEVQNAYQKRLGSSKQKFSGTMPVGFARWHIPFVRQREYYVSEKTDGVRYFLVVAGGACILVDRSNHPYTSCGLDLLPLVLPEGTVLDGEFVHHQNDRKYVFIAFDIIATGPSEVDSHVNKPFSERLIILNDFLSETGPYANGIRVHAISRSMIITILRKRWMPLRYISDVFRQIHVVQKPDQSLARLYKDEKRVHFTDGIVFCPNSVYVPNTHKEYLKWKWADLITIDFLARLDTETNKISISCGGPRNNDIDLESIFILDPTDVVPVQQVLAQYPRRSGILEFGFNAEKGLWNYKCPRPDKNVANYIHTVLGTLVNVAEAISEEELQFRLTTSRSEDWSLQMKKFRKSLLDKS